MRHEYPSTVDRAPRGRLDSLTGLRALAALIVFAHHLPYPGVGARAWDLLTRQGAVGVTFFFVLSGFVLTWSRRDRDTPRPFYRRRFARIYPSLFVALVAGLLLNVALGTTAGPLASILPFLGLQDWVPNSHYYFADNGVTWSLSAELFFYFTFPLYAGRLFSLSRRRRREIQLAMVGVILAVACLYQAEPNAWTSWLVNHCPAIRVSEFVLGALAAVDVAEGTWTSVRLRWVVVLAAAAYLVAGFIAGPFMNVAVPVVPLTLLIGSIAVAERKGRAPWLARRPAVWGGEVSYCFYLVHGLVLLALTAALGLGFAPTLVIGLPLAVACAALLHYTVERPWEARLRHGRNSVVVAGGSTHPPRVGVRGTAVGSDI